MPQDQVKPKSVQAEEEVLKFWQEQKIFEKSLEQTKNSPVFSFYDGPPFATGTPHYGHIVASLMKDMVPRYQTMRGKYVKRVWGWDTHGLPVENLIEKELNLKDKKDILDFGVAKFNEACRDSVLRYADIWHKFIPRIGRWVDMDQAYLTMNPEYMESIWWVFKKIWDRGLIYEGYKAMHICPRCETTLANFEITQNYKDIKDLSVTAKFELVDEPGTFVLAWTTTPWTLPANVALAVGEQIIYCQIKKSDSAENFILAKERIPTYFKENEFEIIREFTGKELVDKKYRPLFPYYLERDMPNKENIYQIVSANFVTIEDGVGVVHIAPAFGEEDMVLGQTKKLPLIQNVDISGHFTAEVTDFAGDSVKPMGDTQATDVKIIKYLAGKNLLFAKEQYQHSYPHCWRCDTPLLNYATSSWFVKVTDLKEKLIANNQQINWVPEHLKDGRFGRWLADARDWAISRSRYWGDPLPVWRCENKDCGKLAVLGSIAELEKLSGQKVTDLHKHIVDEITWTCSCGQTMRRIPEVLDCWFESGSMPFAQEHFPFKDGDDETAGPRNFPAEFIAEGIDQTRGWFYTLLVISTALYGKTPYLNVVANGIVAAEDGNKMSKRLKNYPEPDTIIEKFGADALRYYLLTSPVMHGENLNFSENGVKESWQKVVALTENILSFYQLYVAKRQPEILASASTNLLDQWILAKLQLLIQEVTDNLTSYHLVKATRPLAEFINDLSTWWLRRSRDRFKAEGLEAAWAIATLENCLLTLAKVAAPALPFLTERIYQILRGQKVFGAELESVHLTAWPLANGELINQDLLIEMERARADVEKGLALRAEHKIKVRQPLLSFSIPQAYKFAGLNELLKDELNVLEIIQGKDYSLNTEITPELKRQGILRELIRQVNNLRKDQGLTVQDQVTVYWQSTSQDLIEVLSDIKLLEELKKSTASLEIKRQDNDSEAVKINGETVQIKIEQK